MCKNIGAWLLTPVDILVTELESNAVLVILYLELCMHNLNLL